ncbi:HETdomain-containing protein [Colletotrichum sojae]|uniref:HETdomain-containing protein n=1 Tax=Colletotrichum sojae TaxID=2175907 RepID=A0A8H6IYP9_9PEZI|nr:HETdomain-containing protein [Colletotrichum sojae]
MSSPSQQQQSFTSNSTSATGGFKYTSLPDSADYIRLLELHPLESSSSESTGIRCVIRHFALAEAPPYNAVSYTWGLPTPTATIEINKCSMDVRLNCEAVLSCARRYDSSILYWIDAICINQENLEEKGIQVAMMGKIFEGAQRVVAHVGEHTDDSKFLYKTLRTWKPFFERAGAHTLGDALGPGLRTVFLAFRALKGEAGVIRLYDALLSFVERSYFQRLWILQELFLGRQADLHCGNDHLPVRLFQGIVATLSLTHVIKPRLHPFWDRDLISARRIIALRVASRNQSRLRFSQLNDDVISLGCQDKRDKVYGILSMIDWAGEEPVWPNYTIDRFDLALEMCEKISKIDKQEEAKKASWVLVSHVAEMLAHNLELRDGPSAKLREAIQRQSSLAFGPAMPSDSVTMSCSRFTGFALVRGDSGQLELDGPEVEIPAKLPRVLQLPNNTGTLQNQTELFSETLGGDKSIIVPSRTEPGDWCLFNTVFSLDKEGTYRMKNRILIAREHDDGLYWIVGRGYNQDGGLFFVNMRLWREQNFVVYIGTEDALVMEIQWPEKGLQTPLLQRITSYIGSGFCGQPGSSYAVMNYGVSKPENSEVVVKDRWWKFGGVSR